MNKKSRFVSSTSPVFRQAQRFTELFSAYSDYNEAHDKMVSKLADVSVHAGTHLAEQTLEAREKLDQLVREEYAPHYRELLDLIESEESTDSAVARPSGSKPHLQGINDLSHGDLHE